MGDCVIDARLQETLHFVQYFLFSVFIVIIIIPCLPIIFLLFLYWVLWSRFLYGSRCSTTNKSDVSIRLTIF